MRKSLIVVVLLVVFFAIASTSLEAATPPKSGRSVSPGGKYVFTWKQVGMRYSEFPVFDCYLRIAKRPAKHILRSVMADGEPSARWSSGQHHLIIEFPQQVEIQSIVYSLQRSRKVFDSSDLLMGFSSDERFTLVLEDRGDDVGSSAWLRVLDLSTGKSSKVAQVNFGDYGTPSPCEWMPKSSKFAYVDVAGNLWGVETKSRLVGPLVRKWRISKGGKCSDLSYVPGKGIYFVQRSGNKNNAYYTADLRSYRSTAVLPVKKPRP